MNVDKGNAPQFPVNCLPVWVRIQVNPSFPLFLFCHPFVLVFINFILVQIENKQYKGKRGVLLHFVTLSERIILNLHLETAKLSGIVLIFLPILYSLSTAICGYPIKTWLYMLRNKFLVYILNTRRYHADNTCFMINVPQLL